MLTKEQKSFIEGKVRQLKSMEKIKEFYKRKSEVAKYAYQYANKIFKK